MRWPHGQLKQLGGRPCNTPCRLRKAPRAFPKQPLMGGPAGQPTGGVHDATAVIPCPSASRRV